ncbi:hypothetical protein [Mesorhizobium sp. AR07]|uniref:hypothetical protein n=1 Tax=Mesorhizobium sp. AR07 TaxID=2865838 RepID=UPI0039B6F7C0
MIATDNLQREPPFQFVERHCGMFLRIVGAARGDVAGRRARKQVDRTHHRPDQPLDVPPIMRPGDGPIFKGDAMLRRPTDQRLSMEFPAIVDVDHVRQPENGPRRLDIACLKPGFLRHHNVLDAKRYGGRRRTFQSEVEARHHPACNVDGQCQPRPLKGPAMHGVNDKQIDQCVVDLDDVKRMIGAIFLHHRLKPFTCRFCAFPITHQ